MDLNELMTLPLEEKYSFIQNEGTFIAGRMKNELTYNLYSIFLYYAEICFNLADNSIEEIILFNSARVLDPYLEEIRLPELD